MVSKKLMFGRDTFMIHSWTAFVFTVSYNGTNWQVNHLVHYFTVQVWKISHNYDLTVKMGVK